MKADRWLLVRADEQLWQYSPIEEHMQTPTYYGNIGVLSEVARYRVRLHRRLIKWVGTLAPRRRSRRGRTVIQSR